MGDSLRRGVHVCGRERADGFQWYARWCGLQRAATFRTRLRSAQQAIPGLQESVYTGLL